MNKFPILFMMLLSASLAAQEEVIFDRLTVHGGFGGPIVELTTVDDQAGIMVGGGGGVILNSFFLGGFGQGGSFAEHVADNGRLYPIHFGYGGLWLGYVTPTQKAFHFFGSLKIAGGSISITEDRDDSANTLYDEAVFVVQPEVGVEVNMFKWFRIALTGNYRLVSGIQRKDLAGLSNRDFNSGGIALTLRFGKFYREKD